MASKLLRDFKRNIFLENRILSFWNLVTWPRAGVNLVRKMILRTVGMPPARSNDVAVAKPASELPSDFTPDLYLQLNPDLIAAGVDPSVHFLSNGQFERRLYTLPELFNKGRARFNPIFETILIVSHEASRTGAPILALNLVQSFSNRYNIVVLLLGEGPLTGEFCNSGSVVFVEAFSRFNPFVARRVVGEICSRYKIRFGLVNSIESRQVLQGLAESGVPSVILIHEFASYTRPLKAFREAFAWASSVVFSAEITKDNAFLIYPELAATPVSVHPQGKCVLPESIANVSKEGVEKHLFWQVCGLNRTCGIRSSYWALAPFIFVRASTFSLTALRVISGLRKAGLSGSYG